MQAEDDGGWMSDDDDLGDDVGHVEVVPPCGLHPVSRSQEARR